jgi:type II secretory pathway pseudopilin PulG
MKHELGIINKDVIRKNIFPFVSHILARFSNGESSTQYDGMSKAKNQQIFTRAFNGRKSSTAFTLVEAMVAISILSLSITGPMTIAQKGIGSAIYARDQIASFYLAQEAVEYVRNIRDTNRINQENWLLHLASCISPLICKIDARYVDFANIDGSTNTNAVDACTGTCPALSFDTAPAQKFYGYGSGGTWRTTLFTRTIQIVETMDEREAIISVTVSWNTNLFAPARIYTVKEHIFNF